MKLELPENAHDTLLRAHNYARSRMTVADHFTFCPRRGKLVGGLTFYSCHRSGSRQALAQLNTDKPANEKTYP